VNWGEITHTADVPRRGGEKKRGPSLGGGAIRGKKKASAIRGGGERKNNRLKGKRDVVLTNGEKEGAEKKG